MDILLIGLIAAVGVLLAGRFIGRSQDKVLAQYEVLEKRFGLQRRTIRSRWGRGLNERYTLEGKFRGYPVSLYSHYHDGKDRVEWTTLAMETLFAEELDFDLEWASSQEKAKFARKDDQLDLRAEGGFELRGNDAGLVALIEEPLSLKLDQLGSHATCGALRLSNGFLEYREVGFMTAEPMRIRFQEALLILADLADAISLYVAEAKKH